MKNSNHTYQSIPLVVTIIGSKSRKAMYCINVTSLDGTKRYKNAWIPTSFESYTSKQYIYHNPQLNILNRKLIIGNKYRFGDDWFTLTPNGAVDHHNKRIEIDSLQYIIMPPIRTTIAWEYHSQSLVELPMSQTTPAMDIVEYGFDSEISSSNISRIKSKLIDGKVHEYYQSIDRYIIYIPPFLMKNFEKLFEIVQDTEDNALSNYDFDAPNEDIFANDDNPETITEQLQKDSVLSEQFSYMDRREMDFKDYPSNEQLKLF